MYLIYDFEVERKGCTWVQSTNLPLTCATSSYFLQTEIKNIL